MPRTAQLTMRGGLATAAPAGGGRPARRGGLPVLGVALVLVASALLLSGTADLQPGRPVARYRAAASPRN